MKTQLTVSAILVLCTLLCASAVTAQNKTLLSDIPVVKEAQTPLYPQLARQARIEGTVRVLVTTDGLGITKISSSGANMLLLEAAEENVRTWRFFRHKPQTFTVSFVYKLESPEVFGFANSSVSLDLPTRVEVRTKLSKVEYEKAH